MYKELLEKSGDCFYLDNLPLEVNKELVSYYFDIIAAKLNSMHINYQIIKKELKENNSKYSIERILVLESNYAEIKKKKKKKKKKIKKEIYLFTKIACTTDNINRINVVDFDDIALAVDYSVNLAHRFNEYHLIKKNNYEKYSVHHTFYEYDANNLEKEYEKKYMKTKLN